MFSLRIKYLSFFFGLITILSFFNVVYSYYFNLYLNLNTYYFSFFSSMLIALVFFKFEKLKEKISIFNKILTILFGYITIPLILSLPFYFSIYNLSFLDSFFEAISGFTSTGFTIFENIKHIDQSLILWRSSTQWIGGLYFLFSIIYLIDIYDESFKKSLTNYLSLNNYVSKILLDSVNKEFINNIEILGPFGNLNENPIFLIEKIKIIKPKIIKEKFISFFVKKNNRTIKALSFNNLNTKISYHILNSKNDLDILVKIRDNKWNYKSSIELEIIDIITNINKT